MADEFTCPTATWRRLPLATHPAPLADFSTAMLVDWARSTAAHASGSLAALLLAALLLLVFIGWRLALWCTSCCCPSRRPRLLRRRRGSGKASAADRTAVSAVARRILRGRASRSLKAALLLCALGTLGSCIYGLTQTHTTIVSGTLGVLRQAEALAAGALAAGDRLLLSLVDLGNATQALAKQLEAAGPSYAPLTWQPPQQLGSSQEQLGAAAAALHDELSRLRPAALGALQQAQTSYLPLAQSGETMLQFVLYAAFSLLATTALLTAAGAAVDWPAAAKPALALLLLGSLLGWALGAAATLLLRGGNDVCSSLEPLLLSLPGNAPLAQYFLLGQGGSLLGVLLYASGSTSVDVYAAPAAATQTLDVVRAAAQGWPPELSASALPAVDDAAAALTAVLGRLGELEAATAFDAVHPVYLAAKSLACCSALDAAGRLFAALLASGSCALAAALLACLWLRRIDRLGDHGCCHMHSVRDWSLEAQHWNGGEGGSSGEEAPAAGGPKGKQAAGASPTLDLAKAKAADPFQGASAPASPTILAGRANSWAATGPFAAAGSGMWSGLLTQPGSPTSQAQVQSHVQRCHSLPPVRGPAVFGWDPQAPEDLPPPAVALPSPAAGQLPPVLEVAGVPSDGGCEAECSAPPLPAMESEASLAALEETARAAAQLAGHAFSAASRAAGMLNDAARLARASLSGQGVVAAQQGGGAAPQLPPAPQQQQQQARPMERQASRITRPYLNY